MRFYAEIAKSEEQDDGTIRVYGIASTGAMDSAGETILPSTIKAALTDYMKFGAVREMHQPLAAGTAIEASVNDAGEFEFGAHIVDAEAVKKVKAGVYKGFSVGGKCTSRDPLNKSIITGMNLIEVSLVDRPANPEAVINVWKAEEVMSTEIKKSLYSVSNFASLLSQLGSLASDASWEAEYEGDNSPVPQQIKDWLSQGAEVFSAMAHEEVDEFLANLTKAAVAKAAGVDDIAKAGAKFSKGARAALADIHKSMKACDEAMSKLGYDSEKDEDEEASEAKKAADADDIAKAQVVADEAIAKALAPVTAELDVTKADLAKAHARVKELEAQPAPAKALLHVVEKSAGSEVDSIVLKKADGSVDNTATAIRKAMLAPSFRIGA